MSKYNEIVIREALIAAAKHDAEMKNQVYDPSHEESGVLRYLTKEISVALDDAEMFIAPRLDCADCKKKRAVFFNEFNQVIQCHACGQILTTSAL